MTADGIVHWDDCPRRRADMGPMGAEWIDLGVGAAATKSGLRRVRIDPGKQATPAHGHAVEEELVYVLGGAGLSWQGGETFELGPGDFIDHRPHSRPHTLLAAAAGLDVLIMGPDVQAEVGYLPRANVAWIGDTWITAGEGDHPWAREVAAGTSRAPTRRARARRTSSMCATSRRRPGRWATPTGCGAIWAAPPARCRAACST